MNNEWAFVPAVMQYLHLDDELPAEVLTDPIIKGPNGFEICLTGAFFHGDPNEAESLVDKANAHSILLAACACVLSPEQMTALREYIDSATARTKDCAVR